MSAILNLFQRQSQTMKTAQIAVPSAMVFGGGVYAFMKRREYLQDPVLQRAILHLKKDQRVVDFCGDNIQPGFLVTRQRSPGDNWVKYELNMNGGSGKLKTTIIGDYLLHKDLVELEEERQTYEKAVGELKAAKVSATSAEDAKQKKQEKKGGSFWGGIKSKTEPIKKATGPLDTTKNADAEMKKLREEYVPVDFSAYTIDDSKQGVLELEDLEMSKSVPKDQKLWRISSLTASVDEETKILVLPLPESKRQVKVAETKYAVSNYGDLIRTLSQANNALDDSEGEDKEKTGPRRYDDKTEDEMRDEMARKRKQQFGKLVKFRYYQFGGIMGALFFYLFVYRRFLLPTPVMNSVVFNQAVSFARANKTVSRKIGTKFQIVNCNGKMYSYKNDVKFDVILFGTNANGKVKVTSHYDKLQQTWIMSKIDLVTRTEQIPLI